MGDNPVGRPTVMTDAVVQKLEEAFALGCPDIEACLYAGISRTTLHNYQIDNPEFINRKESLKQLPTFKARSVVVKALDEGDKQNAQWYLERKQKDEFSQKSTTVLTGPGADGKILIEVTGVESGSEAAKVGNAEFIPVTTL